MIDKFKAFLAGAPHRMGEDAVENVVISGRGDSAECLADMVRSRLYVD